MKNWYAVHTKPRQERRAEQHLTRQGFDCHLPLIRQQRRRGEVVAALFPRYLFLRLDLQRDSVAPVRSTQGVAGLVKFGERMLAVPEPFIAELLRLRDEHGGAILQTEPHIRPGDSVTIEAGPMAGAGAIFQERRGGQRVLVLMHLLGAQQRVVVPERHVVLAA